MPHERFNACIEACNACAVACDHCAASCLQESNVQQMADCIRLDVDCAQVCRLAAAVMSRGSQFASDVCQLC
ncbi:four-helix bundle copper-binding protein, partial [Salmonella enterica subsp. enterica serovar Typhimurium]|nr:four-helix bundle copper-binding protein [Salmonella enterica subsp. enterica serovar Typhimurium]